MKLNQTQTVRWALTGAFMSVLVAFSFGLMQDQSFASGGSGSGGTGGGGGGGGGVTTTTFSGNWSGTITTSFGTGFLRRDHSRRTRLRYRLQDPCGGYTHSASGNHPDSDAFRPCGAFANRSEERR